MLKQFIVVMLSICILHVTTTCSYAAPDAAKVYGDLRLFNGGSIVFSDGSVQSKAQVEGPMGPQGLTGPVGPANKLTIGTVVNGAQAAATITGTAPNQALNLTLPQGPVGPQGPACSPLGVVCSVGEVYVQTATGIRCGRIKPFINAIGTCIGADCTLNCSDGYGNCDNDNSNGCEVSLTDVYCGACGNVCEGNQICTNGVCENIPQTLSLTASAAVNAGIVNMSASALLTPLQLGSEVTFVTTMFNAGGSLPMPPECSGKINTDVTGTARISCNISQPSVAATLQITASAGGLVAVPVTIPIAATP